MFTLEKYNQHISASADAWDDKYAIESDDKLKDADFNSQGYWPLLSENLQGDGAYYDVGCGQGSLVTYLSRQGYDITGVDTAQRTIARNKKRWPESSFQVASMTSLPAAAGSLDGVVALGTLEYLEGQTQAGLAEIARVLKPDGFFLFEVPYLNLFRRLIYLPLKSIEKIIRSLIGHKPTFAYYIFSVSDLKRMCKKAGLRMETVQIHELPDLESHYGLWIEAPLFRGAQPYKINLLGRMFLRTARALSPWTIATGVVVLARKR